MSQLFQPLSTLPLNKENCRASVHLIGKRLSGLLQHSLKRADRTGEELDVFCDLLVRSLFNMSAQLDTVCQGMLFLLPYFLHLLSI